MKWSFSRKREDTSHASLVSDEAERRLVLTVTEETEVSRFTVGLHACENPCCPCRTVRIECTADGEEGPEQEARPRTIELDVFEREAAKPRANRPQDDQAFAKVVANGMKIKSSTCPK